MKDLGFPGGRSGITASGCFFFPQDTLKRMQAKKMFEVIVQKEGLEFLGWRTVPVRPEILGHKALAKMPLHGAGGFVKRPEGLERGLALTGSSMWPAGCSSSPTTTPM